LPGLPPGVPQPALSEVEVEAFTWRVSRVPKPRAKGVAPVFEERGIPHHVILTPSAARRKFQKITGGGSYTGERACAKRGGSEVG
jgi:hypothetical protein